MDKTLIRRQVQIVIGSVGALFFSLLLVQGSVARFTRCAEGGGVVLGDGDQNLKCFAAVCS